jgi:hypothetical protein
MWIAQSSPLVPTLILLVGAMNLIWYESIGLRFKSRLPQFRLFFLALLCPHLGLIELHVKEGVEVYVA